MASRPNSRWIIAPGSLYKSPTPWRTWPVASPKFWVSMMTIADERNERSAAAAAHDRYRTLFESMDEGFCIIEFFDGPHGPLSDYIHIEANAAYARHTGIPNVVGQKLRAMVGEEADGWVELYGSVLRTGNVIRFQR